MTATAWAATASIIGALIAAAALVVASLARGHARDSATAAQASATEAARANELAAEANERADRAERRATARNDVDWRAELDDDLRLVLINRGADPAHDVEVVLYVNDSRIRQLQAPTFEIVPAGDTVTVHPLGDLDALANADASRRSAAGSGDGMLYVASKRFKVECRVAWQDEAGGPHVDQLEPKRRRR